MSSLALWKEKEPRGGVFPRRNSVASPGEVGVRPRPLGTLRQQVYARPPWLILQTIPRGRGVRSSVMKSSIASGARQAAVSPSERLGWGEGARGRVPGSRRDSAAGFSLSPTEGSRAPRTSLEQSAEIRRNGTCCPPLVANSEITLRLKLGRRGRRGVLETAAMPVLTWIAIGVERSLLLATAVAATSPGYLG